MIARVCTDTVAEGVCVCVCVCVRGCVCVYTYTIVNGLHVTFDLFQALLCIIEGGETNVSLYLCPWRQLVH